MGHKILVKEKDMNDWFDKATNDITGIDPEVLKDPRRVFNLDESCFK